MCGIAICTVILPICVPATQFNGIWLIPTLSFSLFVAVAFSITAIKYDPRISPIDQNYKNFRIFSIIIHILTLLFFNMLSYFEGAAFQYRIRYYIYACILLVASPVGMLYLSKIETGWIGPKILIYVFIKTAIYTLFVISYIKEFNTKELRNIISLIFYIAVNINAVIIIALISGVRRRIVRDEDMAEIIMYLEF
jgi:hypothetical protein